MKAPESSTSSHQQNVNNEKDGKDRPKKPVASLYVSNLPVSISKEKVLKHFSAIKEDIDSIVVKDNTEIQKAYAFLNLKSSTFVDQFISNYNNSLLDGQQITVKLPMQSRDLKKAKTPADESIASHFLNKELNDSPTDCILERKDVKVVFTHLNKDNFTFYAIENEKIEIMENILVEIEEQAEFFEEKKKTAGFSSPEPLLGHIYAAKFNQDGKFYRALIEKVLTDQNPKQSQVKFIDFGNSETVAHCDLFELSKKLASIAPLSVQYKLKDLKINEEPNQCDEIADFITEQLENCSSITLSEIYLYREDKPLRHVVCLIDEKDLCETLISKNYASKCEQIIPKVHDEFAIQLSDDPRKNENDSVISETETKQNSVKPQKPHTNGKKKKRAYENVPPKVDFFASEKNTTNWEDKNPYSSYNSGNSFNSAPKQNGHEVTSKINGNTVNNKNGIQAVPKSMHDVLMSENTDLRVKIVSLNKDKQDLSEKLASLNMHNHTFEDSAKITFDEISKTFMKVKKLQNKDCAYSLDQVSFLILVHRFLGKYTILDIDELDVLYSEVEEKENELKSAICEVKNNPKDDGLIKAKNSAISALKRALDSFLQYVSSGKLGSLIETFDNHILKIKSMFNVPQSNSFCEIEENNIKTLLNEIKSEFNAEQKSFISEKTQTLIDSLRKNLADLSELYVSSEISEIFVQLKLSVNDDEKSKISSNAKDSSTQLQSIASVLLKSLTLRKELIAGIISKESYAKERLNVLVSIFDSATDMVKTPSIECITDISRQNRNLIKEKLTPLLLQHSYDCNEDSSATSSESLPDELVNIKNEIVSGLEAEDKLVEEISKKSDQFFPEISEHALIKDHLKYGGILKKRHFDYFNTKSVNEGKSWKIIPTSHDSALVAEGKTRMIYRVLMSDNFTKASDEYISCALQWSKIDSDCLAKFDYMFLDKMNFSIYYLVSIYSLSFADLIGSDINQIVYSGLENDEIFKFKKQSLLDLIMTISKIHSQNLIHAEIKPSNIMVKVSSSRPYQLCLPSLEIDTMRRVQRTKSYFSSVFGYSQHGVPNSQCFDVSCFGLTLAAVFPLNPLPSEFESVHDFIALPTYIQRMIATSTKYVSDISQLIE